MKKSIHQWFASSKRNYEQPLMCPYCKSLDTPSVQHDHFLNCSASNKRKTERLRIIGKKLDMIATPTTIRDEVIKKTTNYYNTSTNH